MQRSVKIVFVPVLVGILLFSISCNFGTSFPELLATGGIPADAVYDGDVAAITPVFPADGAASGDLTPLFRWSENSAATSYDVKILDADGTTASELADITGTGYQLSSSLQLGEEYTWQVRITHTDGHYGAWQGPWTFSADRLRENLEEHGMENYTGEGTQPVVYSDADGGFYHVIHEYAASPQNYRFGSRDAGGTWNAEVKLNADEVELFPSYTMTGDKAGNLYMVGWDNTFLDDSGHPTALQAKKYSAGSWTDLDDNIDTEVVKFHPIAVEDELWVVYITRSGVVDSYTYELMFSYYDGSAWSDPDQIQLDADSVPYNIIGLGKNDAGNPVVLLEYPELETYTLSEQTTVGNWSTTPGLTLDTTSLPVDAEFDDSEINLLVPSAADLHFITEVTSVTAGHDDLYGITIDGTNLSGTLLVEGDRSSGDDRYWIQTHDWDTDSSGVLHLVYTVEQTPPAYFTSTDSINADADRSYYMTWDPSSGSKSEPDGLGDETVLAETDTEMIAAACTVGSDDTLHILYNHWPPHDSDPEDRYWTYERMGK